MFGLRAVLFSLSNKMKDAKFVQNLGLKVDANGYQYFDFKLCWFCISSGLYCFSCLQNNDCVTQRYLRETPFPKPCSQAPLSDVIHFGKRHFPNLVPKLLSLQWVWRHPFRETPFPKLFCGFYVIHFGKRVSQTIINLLTKFHDAVFLLYHSFHLFFHLWYCFSVLFLFSYKYACSFLVRLCHTFLARWCHTLFLIKSLRE